MTVIGPIFAKLIPAYRHRVKQIHLTVQSLILKSHSNGWAWCPHNAFLYLRKTAKTGGGGGGGGGGKGVGGEGEVEGGGGGGGESDVEGGGEGDVEGGGDGECEVEGEGGGGRMQI